MNSAAHSAPRVTRAGALTLALVFLATWPAFPSAAPLIHLEDLLADAQVSTPKVNQDALMQVSYDFEESKEKWISSISTADLKASDGILMLRGSKKLGLKSPSDLLVEASHSRAKASLLVVRAEGLEPSLPKERDFKSRASTGSATPAIHAPGDPHRHLTGRVGPRQD